jgi:flagellar assembly protein FliH
MKAKSTFTLPTGGYRQYRFPPLAKPISKNDFSAELGWDDTPTQVDVQDRLEEGFQQGLERGHQEGLEQGIDQGKQQGLLEGQKEGFQKGFVSGEQAGKQTFLDAVKPVNDILISLSRWQEEKEQQQRHTICDLVEKVAQQVVRAELTLMPQQILALVDETLEAMPGKTEKVTVHLNPQDLERITMIAPELNEGWKLVAKPELPVGGCHLVTQDAEADASCDSRLESCMEAVKDHLLDQTIPIGLEDNHD